MTTNKLYEKFKQEMLTASNDDCQHFFVENNNILELAYWELLHQNPIKAQELFSSIIKQDIRAHWGYFLSSLVQGKIKGVPSYFELRNFLEIDLNLFLIYYLGEYFENILKYTDWLCTINPEIYKFIGRVFIKNGLPQYGIFYLNRGKDFFFNDPELHYLLAEYHLNNNDLEKVKQSLHNCLSILPEYYPARAMLKNLKLDCKD